MRVAVCDDNLFFLEEFKKQLQKERGIESIDIYSDRSIFLENLRSNKIYDLVFLHINWGKNEEKKLKFGEQLYEEMNHTPIVLLTENSDKFEQHILLSELNLIGYLLKPVEPDILNRYVQKVRKMHMVNYVSLSSHGKTIRLQIDEIIHIESHNHKINIFTENDVYVVYEKISDVKKRLPREFVQCHKSFMVNLRWVTSIESKSLRMCNGKQIPISRTYQKLLHNEFKRCIEE